MEIDYRSETGRKLRKDSAEVKFGMDNLTELITKYYVQQKMSAEDTSGILKTQHGIDISNDIVLRLVSKLDVKRSKAQSLSLAALTMPQNRLLTSGLKSIIDGMLFGDGSITINPNTMVGRLGIGSCHEEFAQYCSDLLREYMCLFPHYNAGAKGIGMWSVQTLHHRDFYEQHIRWYPDGIKKIPADIEFTPEMVLLWYLGDGSISSPREGNGRSLYFATNCFSKESLERVVAPKFAEIGIEVVRITDDSRAFIATSSINKLLQYMGGKSPVKCFDYKFDIEEWRTHKPMKQVAVEANIDYGRLSNWVKQGYIEHSRSPGGKKVVFTEEQFTKLVKRLDSGELPREAGKKTRNQKSQFVTHKLYPDIPRRIFPDKITDEIIMVNE